MLTEVTTERFVAAPAAKVAAAEEARRLRTDATSLVERMAVRARAAGVDHPVAASVALATRVSVLAGPEAFAERIGIPVTRLVEAESGTVRFGDLPAAYDPACAALALDLLSLADLEAQWRRCDDASAEPDADVPS